VVLYGKGGIEDTTTWGNKLIAGLALGDRMNSFLGSGSRTQQEVAKAKVPGKFCKNGESGIKEV